MNAYLFWLLPKNFISAVTGFLAGLRLPRFLLRPVVDRFVRHYRVDLSDVAEDLGSFRSFDAFFVRRLKDGVRPIGEGVVSPVDGVISACEEIRDGRCLQAKGRDYSIGELLVRPELAQRFTGGWAMTFYLAPHNYHRIHSPLDASLDELFLVPGTLWPVNPWAAAHVKNLFAVNERAVLRLRNGNTNVALVAVGALNVGSIRFSFDTLRTNLLSRAKREIQSRFYSPPIRCAKGSDLGAFHLGSTVILLFPAGVFEPSRREGVIRMGETIGRLRQ